MKKLFMSVLTLLLGAAIAQAQDFQLSDKGYFQAQGVNVMAFDDIYPEGHQGGVALIMHGKRLATNGDIRMEATPGQWQPLPKQGKRVLDPDAGTITTNLSYPDSSRHLTGFNPMIYPDWVVNYQVKVKAEGQKVIITVDLDKPVPKQLLGKVGFNMELFPGEMMDHPWIMDDKSGIFPRQANGPTLTLEPNINFTGDFATERTRNTPGLMARFQDLVGNEDYSPMVADDVVAEPYAVGHRFTVRPDDDNCRFTIQSKGLLKLYDGRLNHNNGWFVVRTEIEEGATKEAVRWEITPNIVRGWTYDPVIQVSQVGYHPAQSKQAVIELDANDTSNSSAELIQILEDGEHVVRTAVADKWGNFLRYRYLTFDFSDVKQEGMYKVRYGKSESDLFRIAKDVYDRGVWQPVLEYYLPVQMCHMKVVDKYRIWHEACHMDDAQMAPTGFNYIDGYVQGPSTLTKFEPGEHLNSLAVGGWHDAGDDDLRVESQSDCMYGLINSWEQFNVNYDATKIDQKAHFTQIHTPDGKNDIQQQIEHGALTIVAGYRTLGRYYRGIIARNLADYVIVGDVAGMTDGINGNEDDRWVFTREDLGSDLTTSARLAAASRALKGYNDALSQECLEIATLYFRDLKSNEQQVSGLIHLAVELYLTTGDAQYLGFLKEHKDQILSTVSRTGWYTCRVVKDFNDKKFNKKYEEALTAYSKDLASQGAETPYGVPYRPAIWGAGWNIQSFGYEIYFLHKAYPELFPADYVFNALNFVLGCHPGSNTQSFAAGVGTKSTLIGYGLNRADWSFIPGAVASGTALIRPDFPELLEFPYLWQQMENCIPDNPRYMFLVLAAKNLADKL